MTRSSWHGCTWRFSGSAGTPRGRRRTSTATIGSARRSRSPASCGSRVMAVSERVLIVNADDFGLSRGVNAGVVKAHEHGIVTSASLMVRWPARARRPRTRGLPRAWPRSARRPRRVGVRDGEWRERYRLVADDDRAGARAEARAQLELFRGLTGSDPTHLDSHQHVHDGSPAAHALVEIGEELGVPVRHITLGVRYSGDFYGQAGTGTLNPDAITAENLITLIRRLGPGITELGCHPAAEIDIESAYGDEREAEMEVLCSPRSSRRSRTRQSTLRSFRELRDFPVTVEGPDKVPAFMDHSGFTLWLTGLPRSGKSTVAGLVAGRLRALGVERIEVLDGDDGARGPVPGPRLLTRGPRPRTSAASRS